MFALEVEYLMGRTIASQHDNRRKVEWPPHPSRLFSALVAACEECDFGDEGRDALKWLEREPAPAISVNPASLNGMQRNVLDVYVPVNDQAHLPERRTRQVRWFPAYAPENHFVHFIWSESNAGPYRETLQKLAANVSYIGHSMTPVRVSIIEKPRPANLEPSLEGELVLRVPGDGRFEHLLHVHQMRIKNSSIQPKLGRVVRYAEAGKAPIKRLPRSIFQEQWIFRRISGESIPIENTVLLTQGIRAALLSLAPNPLPETLSGHDADGRPTKKPHLAIVPLASIGHCHADGHIMGLAALLPESLTPNDRIIIEDALYQLREIKLGRLGVWNVERVRFQSEVPAALRFDRSYMKACDTWATVTPVVFGHYPGWRDGKRIKVVAGMCADVGLPFPVEVRIGPVSPFRGTAKATEFEKPKQASGRIVAHVSIRFAEPVSGPVILGAGRFLGLGLFRPLWVRKGDAS
jgi:CRISPR-associated protein Csb2